MSKNENKTLDCRGLSCPAPLTQLRHLGRKAEPGQEITLLSDDPVSLRDVPAFCNFMGHKLVSLPDDQHPHRFIIKKKE